jgi:hypothetical protein
MQDALVLLYRTYLRILFTKCVEEAFSELPDIGFFSEVRRETVWKVLRTGQPPHHQPRHRRVDEGLPGGA